MSVFWWNAVGSLLAALANLYGAWKGDPRLAQLRASIAALALFYLLGYLLVIFSGWDPADWSAFYRRVALVSWPLVWVAPPLIGTRTHQRTTRALKQLQADRRE